MVYLINFLRIEERSYSWKDLYKKSIDKSERTADKGYLQKELETAMKNT